MHHQKQQTAVWEDINTSWIAVLFLVLCGRQIFRDRLTRKDANFNFRHALGITGLHNMRAIIGRCFFDTRFAKGRQIRRGWHRQLVAGVAKQQEVMSNNKEKYSMERKDKDYFEYTEEGEINILKLQCEECKHQTEELYVCRMFPDQKPLGVLRCEEECPKFEER